METITESPAHAATHSRPAATGKPSRAKSPRSLVKPLLIGVIAVGAVAWIVHFAIHAYHYVETENAYIVGHLHQISTQIDGQVKEVLVSDNENVKAGAVLLRLDPQEFEIAVQKASAGLAQARAQESQAAAASAQADAQRAEADARVVQSDAQIAQARTQLDLAQLTASRSDQLLKNGGASTQADVDSSHSALAAAQANLDAAIANRSAAQASLGSADAARKAASAQTDAATANVAAAEASVQEAQRQLAYTTLTAPADGRVGNKNVESGNRVSAGQTLMALTEPTPWIVANFKETQLPRIVPGQPVEITVDALPGQVLTGRVDSLAPASGAQFALLPPDNATGNFNKVVQRIPVKIILDPDSLSQFGDRLRFGYSVVVNVRVR